MKTWGQPNLLAWGQWASAVHVPFKPSFPRYPGQTREDWFRLRCAEVAPRTACSFCLERLRQALPKRCCSI